MGQRLQLKMEKKFTDDEKQYKEEEERFKMVIFIFNDLACRSLKDVLD